MLAAAAGGLEHAQSSRPMGPPSGEPPMLPRGDKVQLRKGPPAPLSRESRGQTQARSDAVFLAEINRR